MRLGLTRGALDTRSILYAARQRVATPAMLHLLNSILLGVPVVTLVVLGYRQRWVSEDAFISLRVVDQILAGNGPVFNAGERVEAHTNLLWVAILATSGAFGIDTVLTAVFLGIVLSGAGLLAAMAGAVRLDQHLSVSNDDDRSALVIPVGMVVFSAVPVVWDFVTSGLESGLGFGWLGLSFWILVRSVVDGQNLPSWQWNTSALVLGLGPFIRPDFAIFSAGFLLALLYLRITSSESRISIWNVLSLAASACAIPLGYQIFRMGYYASLVPNTALTKEAGQSNWEQGRIYLNDFIDPYYLCIPVTLILGWSLLRIFGAARRTDWPGVIALTVPVATAMLHALYVVRVGGDFMHGRLLLPALFALLLPFAAVRVSFTSHLRPFVVGLAIAVLLTWSYFAATSLRPPPAPEGDGEPGIVDERAHYVEEAEHPNPVTIDDFEESDFFWAVRGTRMRELAETGSRTVVIQNDEYPISDDVPPEIRVVIQAGNVGMLGYAAGTSVYVADRLSLADPIGSRLELEERGRPGHEKRLPISWVFARFTALETDDINDPAFAHAREALQCGKIADLIEATSAPLTAERFLENIRSSWSFHNLRIPTEPAAANETFCE